MDSTLRPMSASQVLDRTFYIYRNNFVLFAGIALIYPTLRLLVSLAELWWFGKPPVMEPGQLDPKLLQALGVRMMAGGGVGVVIFTAASALASSATAYAVSVVHLGRTTTIVDSYRRVSPIFWRVLWLTVRIFWVCWWPLLLSYAVMFVPILLAALLSTKSLHELNSGGGGGGSNIGMMFLGLGGLLIGGLGAIGSLVWMIYAYCRYALAVPACTVENLTAADAMRRSKFLSRGSLGRILGVYALTVLMAIILGTVLELPVMVTHNIFTPEGQKSLTLASLIWLQGAQFAGTALAGPIATVAMALMYYDERIRKEAFDLQLMMQAMPGTIQAPAPPPSASAIG